MKKSIFTSTLPFGILLFAGFILSSPNKLLATEKATTTLPSNSQSSPAGTLKDLPIFSLPDLEGKIHSSTDWKDKVVLIDFWATWCTGCRETIPLLNSLQEKFQNKGLIVTGISVDKSTQAKLAKFVRKQKMTYNILWDANDTQSKVFGFEALPSVYIFGRDGHLLKALPSYTASQEKDVEALVYAQFK